VPWRNRSRLEIVIDICELHSRESLKMSTCLERSKISINVLVLRPDRILPLFHVYKRLLDTFHRTIEAK
jgi:hypothetical protein